ncbi:acetoin pyruvate dehydrogenase complex, E3 component, dihydrolipoamide dehydrogenase [Lacticaseibacillus paracasei subsp. tolerans DSM 20258]|nr:acetoin pyruvate dehydrogenase complex, E3 component, dihydrolipoamide dehydrogenase [Lacticaseibacillus paracasei subsp. tolerans DSM 20258]MCT3362842.1 dihydrolipoyl dehydrogenase [Lacticaseibacillus paracasei]GEL38787.1 dihydrolipoyl dehydrogenase [Lacticaseibacillus paracasei subsp. tolerans]
MTMNTDLVVLGGGPGGYVAAIRAAQLGMQVVLVEKAKVGGICLHKGCIPTKSLLHSGETLRLMQSVATFGGIIEGKVGIDFAKIQARKATVVDQLYRGVQGLMKKNKITVLNGTGAVLGPSIFSPVSGTVSVTFDDKSKEDVMIVPKHVIIATGSSPKTLPSLPIDEKMILTSNGMLELTSLPKKVAIIGGGVIGVEWASLLNDFGVDVTIVEFLDQLVINESQTIARELQKQLENRGIHIQLGAKVEQATIKNKQVALTIAEQSNPLIVDKVMVAIGRQPNVEGIGLQNTSIKYSAKGITHNAFYQTTVDHIYAIGDVIDTLQLAHVAMKEGIIAVEHMAGLPVAPLNYNDVPRCTYTDPEIASVGYTSSNYPQDRDVKIGRFNFNANAKAIILGDTAGFVEVLRDVLTDDIIGVSIIGAHATDMIAEMSDAMYLDASATEIGDAVHPHPSLSEAIQEATLDTHKIAIHK